MKIADVRDMTPDQMSDEVVKLRKEAFNMRFQRATGQLENTARLREIRRTIARRFRLTRTRRNLRCQSACSRASW